jgi:hypothetical protein
MDAECTKQLTDEMDLATDNIIFYGNVPLPDGIKFNKKTMYNDPSIGAAIRAKKTFLEKLSGGNITTPKLVVIGEGATLNKAQQSLGVNGKIDMIEKGTMKVLATVDSAAQFNAYKQSSAYACKHVPATKKMRIFFGNPNITGNCVIGASCTEYRTLTFKETLKMGRSAEVQAQVDNMFDTGMLTEGMGVGQTAWTEQSNYEFGNAALKPFFTDKMKTVINTVYTAMNTLFSDIDFFAVDVSVEANGTVYLTNVTTSPSLQNIDILSFVSEYFKQLVNFGRVSLKKKLAGKIETLSLSRIKKVLELLDKEEEQAA